MSDAGYVYVLINPSMQGLIKVGKTTKDPNERAEELSRATGVPTPFVVGYQMAVNNCTRAEEFVHTKLEQQGFRVSDNREFFNATMTDAINAILEYKQNIDEKFNDDSILINQVNSDNVIDPWFETENTAFEYYYGFRDKLQDYNEALKYYKQAAKLGSPSAWFNLGEMYQYGKGCSKDTNQAIEYYKEGIKRENNECQGALMTVYFDLGHIDNAQKCWNRFVENIDIEKDSLSMSIIYNYFVNSRKYNITVQRIEILEKYKEKIWSYVTKTHNEWLTMPGAKRKEILGRQLYIKNILKITSPTGSGVGCAVLPMLIIIVMIIFLIYC